MNREALADRVLNYCDALAAFSLVNAFAFLVTLAEPDIRCSIAKISTFVIIANLTMPVFISLGLIGLRRFEQSLRADDPKDARVDAFWKGVQVARLALVWSVATLVTVGVYAAGRDPTCAGLVP